MEVTVDALVGRDAELGTLAAALDRTRKSRGGSVFLVGEPGIGKSRLAREVTRRAGDARMRVLRGRASHVGVTVPFRALTEALHGLFRAGDAPNHPELIPYRPILGRLIPEWRDQAPSEGSDSLALMAEAVLRLITLAGQDRGCLLVLDDLHDADAETLAVVDYLVDHLDQQPVLLLGTARTEAGAAQELVRAAGRRQAARVLELTPLDDAETRQLIASALGTPRAEILTAVLDRLCRDCGGNPFIIEEMLNGLIAGGTLTASGGGWEVVGDLSNAHVPSTLVQTIADRADRLGQQAHHMLRVAAVLGRRFPLTVLQAVTGLVDRSLMQHLHAAAAAQLVVPDEQGGDWYAFRHALTADALLAGMGPASRAQLAAAAADMIEQLYPQLAGDWCQITAGLRLAAGDSPAAGRLLAEAGRRAFTDGAAHSAVELLSRARELLPHNAHEPVLGDVVETLALALVEAGQIEGALALTEAPDVVSSVVLDSARRAALHTQLGWAAAMAGMSTEGMAQVDAARALVDPEDAGRRAAIDVVAAYLCTYGPEPDRLGIAEALAREALATAQRLNLPVVACSGWQLAGILARHRSMEEADGYLRQMLAMADAHGLLIWRLRALTFLSGNEALREGSIGRMVQARDEAMRAGAIANGYGLDASIAFQAVLCGDYPAAEQAVDRCMAVSVRLRMPDTTRYAVLTMAMLAAHQGRRTDMERALDQFRSLGGEESHFMPCASGLCRGVFALLDEDRKAARTAVELGVRYEEAKPTIFHLAGRHGLVLLLRALDDDLDLSECLARMSAPSSRLRWNRHFALLAQAVLLGRSGQAEEAGTVVAQAREAAAPFVMAGHLGARLVAEAAIVDGWGTPATWLRGAEAYFHAASVPAVASACRSLLRQAGVVVQRRRHGIERVPETLRSAGVTAREYDVLELLASRLGNKEIGERLYISPRTVEKHVASLMLKTGRADRLSLIAHTAGAVRRE